MSGVGTKRVLKLLIDTNVWLDYFLARTNATRPIVELLSRAVEAEDIVRVNVLLYRSAVIGEILCLLALLVVTLF